MKFAAEFTISLESGEEMSETAAMAVCFLARMLQVMEDEG
jgi:hypothetical protein